ncbi:glycoside hydrolase family 9 protein [Mucilaginibacter psychrotolerans]|uniref:Endoglucanase n=1 Tax=Mucilaginibacter psychrotolerans TaxID=1524096 RepID=A0A4Y8SL06_9SPHI|nr:glycoside hydrolase family 9 protein [Mucilaginibacter psychrotolerans]TFF39217.1 cellulase [Mucilaginibacter psychrotolerans]
MLHRRIGVLIIALCLLHLCLNAQTPITNAKSRIRLNQVGFYPVSPKVAIVVATKKTDFLIKDLKGKTWFTGQLIPNSQPAFSGAYTFSADFSAFDKPGRYFIEVEGLGNSYEFQIKPNVLQPVADGSIKAFYYQRASIQLDVQYAGKWYRAAGHPDDKVFVHSSAASEKRPAGFVISSPRGWYDAGDYNKYIVNSGITMATLLSLYEDFPEYMNTVKLNIPESQNQIPDVLDEVLWNLRWMLTMQDPNDGGVYHKLTNARFDGMIMPDKADSARYIVQKSTAATLDFAAVMAQASRILKKFPKQLPGLADSCIKASEYAWTWAEKNPVVIYNQDAMNREFKPAVVTGTYGDRNVGDEFFWAASELYLATGKDDYFNKITLSKGELARVPSWANVKLLGYYSLAQNSGIDAANHPEIKEIRTRLLNMADIFIDSAANNAYQTVMTKSKVNFNWGSNSNAANQGVLLIKAYKLSGDRKYLDYALANLDYILGRNGTGYSYVTGFGSKSTMHPHHRPSIADGVVDPIPGLLAGGPNPGMQDKIQLPSLFPDEAYIDDDQAYASNEIAINWNAPLAYLANAIQALQKKLH